MQLGPVIGIIRHIANEANLQQWKLFGAYLLGFSI